jgi:hypothetical protein
VHPYKAYLQQEKEAAAAAAATGQAADGAEQAAAEGAAAEGEEAAQQQAAAASQPTPSPSKGPASDEQENDDGHGQGDSSRFAKYVARVLKGKGLEMGGNQLEFSGGGNLQVSGPPCHNRPGSVVHPVTTDLVWGTSRPWSVDTPLQKQLA